jgi:HTH-type transcriptional regulator/antitoxin HigA
MKWCLLQTTCATRLPRTEQWTGCESAASKSSESRGTVLNTQKFRPDWASAPGETIADVLEARGLSTSDLAERLERAPDFVIDIIRGQERITLDLARKLEQALGASLEYWMARDFEYQEALARQEAVEEAWLSQLPLKDMFEFGWINPAVTASQKVDACLDFFDVPSVSAWRARYAGLHEAVAFRTSAAFDSQPEAVAAWLRRGEVEAQKLACKAWDAEGFRKSLPYIRSLTREKDPAEFLPVLQKCCAECGVAVVIGRAPSGCRASGATQLLGDRALLLLSFRHLSDDHFWFTFFHESAHLLLHYNRNLFLEGIGAVSATEEEEANQFAADLLIPSEYKPQLMSLSAKATAVIRFARRVGVSPGIVVGQLQHLGRIRHNQLNSLKRRFVWSD